MVRCERGGKRRGEGLTGPGGGRRGVVKKAFLSRRMTRRQALIVDLVGNRWFIRVASCKTRAEGTAVRRRTRHAG